MQRPVLSAADLLTDPDTVLVRRLGIDEHRYRSVRFYRDANDPAGQWRRYEPWMTTLVDADTGRVLGVVDGRDSAGIGAWLAARSQAWRDAVKVVAIDPSAAFRRAIREQLPQAAGSVDAFHLVKLGNAMVTRVRQRVTREAKGCRGRGRDPAWMNRRLLLRAGDCLSRRALARLKATLRRTTRPVRSAPPGASRNSSGSSCRRRPSKKRPGATLRSKTPSPPRRCPRPTDSTHP